MSPSLLCIWFWRGVHSERRRTSSGHGLLKLIVCFSWSDQHVGGGHYHLFNVTWMSSRWISLTWQCLHTIGDATAKSPDMVPDTKWFEDVCPPEPQQIYPQLQSRAFPHRRFDTWTSPMFNGLHMAVDDGSSPCPRWSTHHPRCISNIQVHPIVFSYKREDSHRYTA